jgi:hypothetical protein
MTRLAARLAASALVLSLSAGAALAQAAPAPRPAAAPPSAAHLAAARDLVAASGMARSFEPMVPAIVDQLKQSLVTRPELGKDLNEVLDGMKTELDQQRALMLNNAARIFATAMTEQEIKDVVAFFKSPAGGRWVATQPQVLDELVREMQTWSQGVAEYLMVRVRAEMGKRGHAIQ